MRVNRKDLVIRFKYSAVKRCS